MAEYQGTAGDDSHVGTAAADEIYGHDGVDTLSGSAEDDYIEGGAGRDTLSGDAGNDVLVGDFLVYGGSAAGDDQLYGGDGNDVLRGGGGSDGLAGQNGDDLIMGEAGDDVVNGGGGNDVVRGGPGVDSLEGGGEDNLLTGGYGDRVSYFEAGATQAVIADLRFSRATNDGFGTHDRIADFESIAGGTAFADQFYGNNGNNFLGGGRGDTLMAFRADDMIEIDGAPQLVDGGDGIDHLRLALWGGLIHDPNGGATAVLAAEMTTGYTIDLVAGTLVDGHGFAGAIAGIEWITATKLDDVIRGSGGDEWFAPGRGSDVIDGRGGVDSVSYAGDHYEYYFSGKGGIFADLATGQVIETAAVPLVEPDPPFTRASAPTATVGSGATADSTDSLAGIENVAGTGLGDTLYGDSGNNRIAPGAGNDVVDGRGGIDTIDYSSARAGVVVRLDTGTAQESGTGQTTYDPGQLYGVNVEADDHDASTDQIAGMENAVGSAFADTLVGDGEANRLEGGAGNDVLRAGTGADTLLGGAGNDVLYFGADFTGADIADGGLDRDAIVLQGNYTLVLANSSLLWIESISLQSGANAAFGDTANNFYDFSITTANGNVPVGQQLIVNAQSLRAGEDFTFNGSAETDGKFLIYGGHGVDTLTGGSRADVFFFEGSRWGAGDKVDGGAGADAVVISAGSGLTRIEFAADALTNVESISLNKHFATDPTQKPSYEFVLHNGNVAPGGTLIVNGFSLADPTQTVNVDGSAVQQGRLILYGGAGADVLKGGAGADIFYGAGSRDTLTGGAGADTFQYRSTSDSLPFGGSDLILDFEGGLDKVDLSLIDADTTVAGNQAFTVIGGAQFGGHAGELRIVDMGNNQWLMMADTDGNADADFHLVVTRTDSSLMIGSDFLL